MNSAQGRVISLSGDAAAARALVAVTTNAACPRCASGKGCGAALFASSGASVEMAVPQGMRLVEGDTVEIVLASDSLLRAALIVYGLPLTTALLGAASAYVFSMGDAMAALAALVGLVTGVAAARRYLARRQCLRQFEPVITSRLQQSEVGV